ncbi:MAG: hypothetical protein JSR76_00410 [Verrucomicrobia bacterium]|nr:hypothetical protein [Verrucomicrobiota bacterium]
MKERDKKSHRVKIRTFLTLILLVVCGGLLFFLLRAKEPTLELPATVKECASFELNIAPEDAARIDTLIGTIAKASIVKLLFKKGQMQKIGAELDARVPPFAFLAYIFSHKKLANDMALIQQSSMKYQNFLEGLQKNLLKEYREGCFYPTAKGFAIYLNRDAAVINDLLKDAIEKAEVEKNSAAFRDFVDYLIKTS